MTVSRKDSDALHRPPGPEEVARRYSELCRRLTSALRDLYGMSESETAAILESSCRSFILAETGGSPPDGWVIGGALKSAETHRRMHMPPGGPDDLAAQIAQSRKLAMTREDVAHLGPSQQRALRLRFDEHMSFAAIGAEMGILPRSAERIVLGALATLRQIKRLRDGGEG